MALDAVLRLKGQKQGEIKGSGYQKGRENTISVIAISHSIISPRDAASGLPTGKRMHKPLVITKELDKSSPLLYSVLTQNENLENVEIKMYTPQLSAKQGMGQEVHYYTIVLKNANIASIDFRMANNKHPDLMKFAPYEEIAMTYEEIRWTWVEGGIETSDSWVQNVG